MNFDTRVKNAIKTGNPYYQSWEFQFTPPMVPGVSGN